MYLREAEKLMIESNYAQNEQAFLEIRLMRAITDGQLGRRNEALGGFHICLKVLEENITDIADPNNIERSNLYGLALHEYGTYAKTIGQLDESELAFSKALDVAKVVLGPTHEQTSVVANDLATIYDEKGRYNKAERLAQKAIRIATGPQPEKLATYNFNLGSIVLHKGDVSRARRIFRDALTLAEEGGDEDMKTIITSNITKLDVGH
jgi:tetratricopeptide (TPR) repeat protein